MAESVDALVSNTSGATRAGSTPALGTSVFLQIPVNQVFTGIFAFYGVLKVYLIVYILLKYSYTFQKNKIKNVGHLLANIK